MGDPAKAEHKEPPRLPWLHDEGWTTFDGRLHMDVNYLALHETPWTSRTSPTSTRSSSAGLRDEPATAGHRRFGVLRLL